MRNTLFLCLALTVGSLVQQTDAGGVTSKLQVHVRFLGCLQ